ncbi:MULTISPECIES: hypothetical protein [unclassified Streptomyces]|uniref:MinD/ParA family ATP-binding protein n=1 Tax=unclassified Streptomyces TaxID=2593676 RepID=UPI002E19A112|nr:MULTISPECIES: hypothetical protein [unclassified Streptomyces]
MRRLVAVGSLSGAPGVTALTLSLAAAWPTAQSVASPVVVEADVSGGDLATRFELPENEGLLMLAAGARRDSVGKELEACALQAPGSLRVVVAPSGAEQAASCVAEIASCLHALRGGETDEGVVLLDLGRLTEGPSRHLARAADRLVIVCRGRAEPLVHVAVRGEWLAEVQAELVVMGPCSYPQVEIAEALKVRRERVHLLGWDARVAAALDGRGRVGRRRWRRSPLTAGARTLAARLLGADEDVAGNAGGELAQLAGRAWPSAATAVGEER